MPRPDVGKKRRPYIQSRHGRFRFQSGIVTANLLQRGLTMAQAMLVSKELRTRIAGREELSSDELEALAAVVVRERLGLTLGPEPQVPGPGTVVVLGEEGALPYARGSAVRWLVSAGLGPEEALAVSGQLERWVQSLGRPEVAQSEIDEYAIQLLERGHGADTARRYRLSGWVRSTARPIIVFIGGATGTGKSTLATDLAFRLGIRLITSTDMVRETMRTVLAPEVVPGLHDHSFRGIVQGGQVLSNPRERVLAGFRQQAEQVAVGIRAVVRRALREGKHMIVEGTHLLPPFDAYLPEDADCAWAGVLLAVPHEADHQRRFVTRGRKAPARDARTYLDAFQSVRWVHDDLLHLAEERDQVVLTSLEPQHCLRATIDLLSRALPVDEGLLGDAGLDSVRLQPEPGPPTLMLVLDGLGDEPNPLLSGLTPLAAARPTWLRALAGNGAQGRIRTGGDDGLPETDQGMRALLGSTGPVRPLGRGLVEALGVGAPLPRGAVVMRGNLATFGPDGSIIDRRAGRIRDGVEDLVAGLRDVPLSGGLRGSILATHEHRVLVVVRGAGLSAAITDTDPGSHAPVMRAQPCRALDGSPEAARTAEAVDELLRLAGRHLRRHPIAAQRETQGLHPPTDLLVRGAASTDDLPRPRESAIRGALIAACPTALGVARACGLQPSTHARFTGNLDTDLGGKFDAAARLLPQYELVVVHIKGTDIAAHDRRPLEKRDFLRAVDGALGKFLQEQAPAGLRVVVAADHGTSSRTGDHLRDPVPLLVASWDGALGESADFHEASAALGALGTLGPGELGALLSAR